MITPPAKDRSSLGNTASESLNCFSTSVGRPNSTAPNHTTKIAAIRRSSVLACTRACARSSAALEGSAPATLSAESCTTEAPWLQQQKSVRKFRQQSATKPAAVCLRNTL
eukprot:GHUV01005733.1.p3 GENE.GHUV01005733.1~~GHUV01005733.1.p3  ORF type:complete len:110 (-),score=16.90 GHUV01005733.1:290-619(-)